MHAQKTQLVQRNIGNPLQANAEFNNANASTVPVVLVPRSRSCCSCWYHIPSGAYTIVHNCGDDDNPDGLAPAGLQMCKPYWNHVAYMVTQQSCTYNAPVKSCPTSDNVMVDCELTLVFSIGPNPADVKHFVYNLGALKFNEFLSAETEEAIRQLVRSTPLEEVYELRGSGSEHVGNVLQILNEKFGPFGVTFVKAAITDVVLNEELRRILQGTTEFRTKIKELDKEHDHNMKLVEYDFLKKRSEKDKEYERRKQDLANEIEIALVNREKEKVQMESRREVNVTKAEEQAVVNLKRAQADFKVSANKAKQENEDLLGKIRASCESKRIKVDKECEMKIYEAEQATLIAKNKADALRTEAKAEGDAADSLKVIRSHNLQMAKLEVTEAIAKRSKMVISGDAGDSLIGSILDKDLLGSSPAAGYK